MQDYFAHILKSDYSQNLQELIKDFVASYKGIL
jgi:hypothetical protein